MAESSHPRLNRKCANYQIDAAKVCAQLRTLEAPTPATESQARQLLEISNIEIENEGQAKALKGLEPGEAQEVMQAAHQATNGKITAKAIKQARE
ncbi:hypothetical protein MTX80_03475 [Gordonia amicalis]|nr:hypothetical protein [Gordonia amicalis]UOG22159.1 hypothetical protein MTX80_03475 [Gordonia amicalis]